MTISRQVRRAQERAAAKGKPTRHDAVRAIGPTVAPNKLEVEHLVAVAIIRDGRCLSRGFRSHQALRSSLGDEDASHGKASDEEGFFTSNNRFVTREEAKAIGEEAGQCRPQTRPLLSSDIDW